MQMTRSPRASRYSQRCEPRKPAPPVTTAVGTEPDFSVEIGESWPRAKAVRRVYSSFTAPASRARTATLDERAVLGHRLGRRRGEARPAARLDPGQRAQVDSRFRPLLRDGHAIQDGRVPDAKRLLTRREHGEEAAGRHDHLGTTLDERLDLAAEALEQPLVCGPLARERRREVLDRDRQPDDAGDAVAEAVALGLLPVPGAEDRVDG